MSDNLDTVGSEELDEEAILAMSDEEIDNLDLDAYLGTSEEEDTEEDANEDIEDEDEGIEDEVDEESEDTEENVPSDEESEEEPLNGSEEQKEDEGIDEDEETSTNENEGTSDDDSDDSEKESIAEKDSINYEEEYKDLFKPFKANGREIQIESVDDARRLMQMGANYNKKMAAMKPNLRILRMLENNSLLNEDKLNRLIDLDRHDPEAIKQLVKDSGLDPMDIDPEEESTYQPNTYNVGDKEIAFSETLNEIKDTKSYSTTLDHINNKFDEVSKSVLYDHPELIKRINTHVENGIYDQITGIVETERMMGRLEGKNDLEAYDIIGAALSKAGKLKGTPKQESVAEEKFQKASKPKNTKAEKARERRKKAASTTPSKGSGGKKDYINPLEMSDEEFEKTPMDKFL